jgi:hypothetical protein
MNQAVKLRTRTGIQISCPRATKEQHKNKALPKGELLALPYLLYHQLLATSFGGLTCLSIQLIIS